MESEPARIDELLELKRRFLIPCVYHFYKKPMVIVRAKGSWLYDDTGKKYLDCYSGVGVVNCGHCPPDIVKRTVAQVKRLQHTTTIFITEPLLGLARELGSFLGGGLTRSFFCVSGSEANEGALLSAKLFTGRTDFISLSRSLHGRTYLASGVTGLPFWRSDPSPPSNVHFAPSPTCFDCPLGKTYPDCGVQCAYEVEKILDRNPDTVAAFIAEPVHGNGGIVVPPPEYFRIVQGFLKERDALFIMDEAQTGFCRTGRRFGYEHFGVRPDIVTLCKALGNGLPIAAFVTTDRIAESYTRPGASTFGGNPVCAETALGTLAFLKDRKLEENASRMGAVLRDILLRIQKKCPLVTDVRGLGLMMGMELRKPNGEPAAEEVDRILEDLKDEGVLVGKTGPGRNVLTFMPPLIVSRREMKFLEEKIRKVFEEM